jgi:uncharacterized protein (TIGR02145 family)
MRKHVLIVLFFSFASLVQAQTLSTIQGKVRYNNADSTLLYLAKVKLFNELGVVIDSVNTDPAGSYSFNNLPNGIYSVTVSPIHPWGGVNSTDALVALKHFVGLVSLIGLPKLAGDVDGLFFINAIDAYSIQKRFAGVVPTFPRGDWLSEAIVINIASPAIYTRTIKTLCFGDVNASYIPSNSALPCPGLSSFIYGSHLYHAIQIGSQCWMKENLNIGTHIAGGTDQTNNSIIEKFCYGNDTNNCKIYGGLYQWNEMMQYVTTAGAQGICPNGWHIPTKAEYTTLETTLGGSTVAGDKIREIGITHWNSPNAGATNSSGFTGLGSGRRYNGYNFGGLKEYLDLWTSTSQNSSEAWNFYLYEYQHSTHQGYAPKVDGFSVRCIKN